MTTKKLILTLLIAGVIIIGLIIGFILPKSLDSTDVKDTIRFEIIKSLLQLLVVAVVGTIIAQIVKASEFNKQQALILLDLRMKFLKRLGNIYRKVKSIRRDFRTAGLSTKFTIEPQFDNDEKVEFYKEKMKSLNRLQLNLEDLKKDAEISPAISGYRVVYTELKKMEDYVREVVKESERFAGELKPGSKLADLKRLNEFTKSISNKLPADIDTAKTDYLFKTHFSGPFDNIIEALVEKRKASEGVS